MKATGIVRRIDDLGRVVIPKEIRRTLRIREGDPLEIFTASDGEVIFKKYSPMGELSEFSGQYSDILSRTADLPVIITDRDHVISVAGLPKKDFLERHISKELEEIMENRDKYIKGRESDRLYPIDNCDLEALTAFPIISAGDIGGCVIFLSNGDFAKLTDTEVKLAQVAATFLGKQMEE
ncbi:MAG: AbrB/MazE/SpoVT family DNA-binding domain-containing protein [Clostridia bacterium]|nr:AbrB/MazE/SpoVT family DNA-binding domain-containing protein [Clostridia bacterium]